MRKLIAAILIVLAAGLGALAVSFLPAKLPVDGDLALTIPAAQPPPEMRLSVLYTGRIIGRAGLAYRGGDFAEERSSMMAPILVEHPRGALLIDAGFGRNIDAHYQRAHRLIRAVTRYEKGVAAADQMRAAGFDPAALAGVVLTHAHWDHSSGVEDFRGVPVWLPQAERDFVRACGPQADLLCSFGELDYRVYDFPHGAYLGFDRSFDVYGDGAIVIVPAPGHTPGSVIVFVTMPDQQRYAFIGDLAWAKEGVDLPAERPWLARNMVREDAAQVRRALVHVHKLMTAVPNLTVVPAHDPRVLDRLPRFGAPR